MTKRDAAIAMICFLSGLLSGLLVSSAGYEQRLAKITSRVDAFTENRDNQGNINSAVYWLCGFVDQQNSNTHCSDHLDRRVK